MSFGPGGYNVNPPPVPPAGGATTLPVGTAITGSFETYGPDNLGAYGLGRQIFFQVATGDVGSVFVNYNNFNSAQISAQIASLVHAIEAMYGLSNP